MHSLLGTHANSSSGSSSGRSDSSSSTGRSGEILDGVSLSINHAGQTPPGSLRGRLWGGPGGSAAGTSDLAEAYGGEHQPSHQRKLTRGSVFFSSNARTFGGNTYSRTNTDAGVEVDMDVSDIADEADAKNALHAHDHLASLDEEQAKWRYSVAVAGGAGMDLEMVTRHTQRGSGDARASRRGSSSSSSSEAAQIPISAETPTVLNMPRTSNSTSNSSSNSTSTRSAQKQARSSQLSPSPSPSPSPTTDAGAGDDAVGSSLSAFVGDEEDGDDL